ncbi:probable pectate lyase 4 [Eutrema salsugineum]|uniref:probable pectate lyase 4 n=1 Tax=Eutrema salsugineum TaxID=72664 RepID=UPI000CED714D|nr:probable pectate lyase 4 [Eutrema salsugineum]
MASLVLTFSLLLATFSSPLVEAAYSNGYTLPTASLNPIDSCRRRNPNWASNRQALAHCAVGFGKSTIGGKQGRIYVVTSPSDSPGSPKPGTLRYGVIQPTPLWITFASDMVIVLQRVLMVSSYKTIDGRGARVEIRNGPCIMIHRASHVIIHGISIHDCKKEKGGDGDAITVFQSSHIWIDHCYLSRCQDGLIDVIHSSTAVTISNNYFTQHDKVVLLGHDDSYVDDKKMRVTVAFNYFGPGLIERMPRIRRGYVHVANNWYEKWQMYAIGGSADPIIFSEGNYFVASKNPATKQVTKRMGVGYDFKKWKWSTSKDVFFNGAFFIPSGVAVRPPYKLGESFPVSHGSLVPSLVYSAGPLRCVPGKIC